MWKTPGEEACSPLLFPVLFPAVVDHCEKFTAALCRVQRSNAIPIVIATCMYVFFGSAELLQLRSRRARVCFGYQRILRLPQI